MGDVTGKPESRILVQDTKSGFTSSANENHFAYRKLHNDEKKFLKRLIHALA